MGSRPKSPSYPSIFLSLVCAFHHTTSKSTSNNVCEPLAHAAQQLPAVQRRHQDADLGGLFHGPAARRRVDRDHLRPRRAVRQVCQPAAEHRDGGRREEHARAAAGPAPARLLDVLRTRPTHVPPALFICICSFPRTLPTMPDASFSTRASGATPNTAAPS